MNVQIFNVEKVLITNTDYKPQHPEDFRTIDIRVTDKDGVITTFNLFVKPGFVPEFFVKSEAE
jgi:hypothetical protein